MNRREPARVPVAVIMITFNEAHHLAAVLENVSGWAQEVLLLDSYSSDDTVDIGLRYGVRIFQRSFRGFGDQWNFAITELPVVAPWTMKLDPDERLTDELKRSIASAIAGNAADALVVRRHLWFMGKPLHVRQSILRLWRTGMCRFSDVAVNEHPLVNGKIAVLEGDLEHHDSPHLHHWWDKQNRYTTAEAISAYRKNQLAATSKLFGNALERQMWLKTHYRKTPFFGFLVFCQCWLLRGAWRAGRIGFIWARLRSHLYRMIAYKLLELERSGACYELPALPCGPPDPRVPHYD